MDENWVKIFDVNEEFKANLAAEVLNKHGIESYVQNNKDSAYAGLFGKVYLYVPEGVAKKAHDILKKEGYFHKDEDFV